MGPCNFDARLALFGKRKTLTIREAFDAGATVKDLVWVANELGSRTLDARRALALGCARYLVYRHLPFQYVMAALDIAQNYDGTSPEALWGQLKYIRGRLYDLDAGPRYETLRRLLICLEAVESPHWVADAAIAVSRVVGQDSEAVVQAIFLDAFKDLT